MKPMSGLFIILAVALIGIAPSAALADKPSSYLVLKGGYYSPSKSFDLDNVHFNTKDGFVVEGALGHYFLPFLAVELGGGYLESKTSASLPSADAKLRVYPVVATGKLLLPMGPIEPYGEFGVGVYIVDIDLSGTPSNFSGSTQGAFGYHAGGGLNLDLGPNVFLGAEGRYLWVKRSYGPVDIKLDGFTVTGDLGFRF
jgi:opacity protein-like surface antigen